MLREERASVVAQLVKNSPAMQDTLVQSLGWEDPLEKGKATHSSILAWRIPWTVHGVFQLSSVQFSHSVVSNSLWLHESQHARPPCPSPTPRVHSDLRPLSQWCHPAISSSVVPFSSCPQSWSLKSEVKWALGSITTNKASGGDGIPVELFQILKDDSVKVLHSICQQIWKTQQWPQDWKRSVFIPIAKKGNAKECSNYHPIALISHTSKVKVKVTEPCLTLYDPSPWNSRGQNTGMGSLSLLHGIFPTQELNWGLLHCRWILYQLSYQGSPMPAK